MEAWPTAIMQIQRKMKENRPPLIKRLLRKAQSFIPHLRRAGQQIMRFGSLAWSGAAIGSVFVVVAFMGYMGFFLRTGLGVGADVAVSVLLGALGTTLIGLLVMLVITVLRAWPRLFAQRASR